MPVFVHLTGLMNLKFLSHWIVSEDATKRFLGWDLSKGNQKLGKSSNISLRKPSNLPLCKIRTPDQTAETNGKVFVTEIISRHGVPVR